MISFFRKIRQNLLNEGKTGRYIKYAIGEIVLVVLGILIALQINDWNQHRIDRNNEKVYLKRIVSEINTNNQINKRLVWSRLEKKLFGLNQAKAYAEGRLGVENPIEFINNVNYGGISSGGYDMGGDFVYDELVNTGNMKLLTDDEVKNAVVNYYASLKAYEVRLDIFSSDFLSIINGISPFDSKHPNQISEYDQLEAMKTFKSKDFRIAVDTEISYSYKLRDYLTRQEKRSIELIELIENKLNQQSKSPQ